MRERIYEEPNIKWLEPWRKRMLTYDSDHSCLTFQGNVSKFRKPDKRYLSLTHLDEVRRLAERCLGLKSNNFELVIELDVEFCGKLYDALVRVIGEMKGRSFSPAPLILDEKQEGHFADDEARRMSLMKRHPEVQNQGPDSIVDVPLEQGESIGSIKEEEPDETIETIEKKKEAESKEESVTETKETRVAMQDEAREEITCTTSAHVSTSGAQEDQIAPSATNTVPKNHPKPHGIRCSTTRDSIMRMDSAQLLEIHGPQQAPMQLGRRDSLKSKIDLPPPPPQNATNPLATSNKDSQPVPPILEPPRSSLPPRKTGTPPPPRKTGTPNNGSPSLLTHESSNNAAMPQSNCDKRIGNSADSISTNGRQLVSLETLQPRKQIPRSLASSHLHVDHGTTQIPQSNPSQVALEAKRVAEAARSAVPHNGAFLTTPYLAPNSTAVALRPDRGRTTTATTKSQPAVASIGSSRRPVIEPNTNAPPTVARARESMRKGPIETPGAMVTKTSAHLRLNNPACNGAIVEPTPYESVPIRRTPNPAMGFSAKRRAALQLRKEGLEFTPIRSNDHSGENESIRRSSRLSSISASSERAKVIVTPPTGTIPSMRDRLYDSSAAKSQSIRVESVEIVSPDDMNDFDEIAPRADTSSPPPVINDVTTPQCGQGNLLCQDEVKENATKSRSIITSPHYSPQVASMIHPDLLETDPLQKNKIDPNNPVGVHTPPPVGEDTIILDTSAAAVNPLLSTQTTNATNLSERESVASAHGASQPHQCDMTYHPVVPGPVRGAKSARKFQTPHTIGSRSYDAGNAVSTGGENLVTRKPRLVRTNSTPLPQSRSQRMYTDRRLQRAKTAEDVIPEGAVQMKIKAFQPHSVKAVKVKEAIPSHQSPMHNSVMNRASTLNSLPVGEAHMNGVSSVPAVPTRKSDIKAFKPRTATSGLIEMTPSHQSPMHVQSQVRAADKPLMRTATQQSPLVPTADHSLEHAASLKGIPRHSRGGTSSDLNNLGTVKTFEPLVGDGGARVKVPSHQSPMHGVKGGNRGGRANHGFNIPEPTSVPSSMNVRVRSQIWDDHLKTRTDMGGPIFA